MAYSTPMDLPLLSVREYAVLAEEDGYRVELSRGRLVREAYPAALHAWICARVAAALEDYAQRAGGEVLAGGGFVLEEAPATVRAPDVAWVASRGAPEARVPAEGFWPGAPDLAVEINSPSNSASYVLEKVQQYLEAGSRMVWVIDPPTRTVTVYRSREHIHILGPDTELDGADVLPGLRLQIASVFPDEG
ncbi:MAG TPA: Uma2 family endonuclease [Longimicrobiales bacterium]|nr:Uma2 family endonuclease [Longimicrobiales bacterium]